jgi:hypothetical protein
MDITDQILQKINTSPQVRDHSLIKKNNLLIIKGRGYDVRIKVINEKEVILSKTWKRGIIGVFFCKQKGLQMERLIESISLVLEKDDIKIHCVMMR